MKKFWQMVLVTGLALLSGCRDQLKKNIESVDEANIEAATTANKGTVQAIAQKPKTTITFYKNEVQEEVFLPKGGIDFFTGTSFEGRNSFITNQISEGTVTSRDYVSYWSDNGKCIGSEIRVLVHEFNPNNFKVVEVPGGDSIKLKANVK